MTADLPPSVQQSPGRNALPRLAVSTARATAEVYLHGGHLTAWQPSGAEPVIWVSRDSQFLWVHYPARKTLYQFAIEELK